jgi:hypothetical protein
MTSRDMDQFGLRGAYPAPTAIPDISDIPQLMASCAEAALKPVLA